MVECEKVFSYIEWRARADAELAGPDDRAESTVSDDIVAKRTGRVVSGFHLSDCDKQSRKE
jgi:hypothetical protein